MKPKARTTQISAATRQQPPAKATDRTRSLGGLAVSTIAALVFVVAMAAGCANGNSVTQSAPTMVAVPTAVSNLASVPPAVSTDEPTILPSLTRNVPPPLSTDEPTILPSPTSLPSPTRPVVATPTIHI